MAFSSITLPTWVLVVSTWTAAALTSTLCSRLPTSMVISTRRSWSTVSTTLFATNVWNPDCDASTLYVPTGTDRMRYAPEASEVTFRLRFVSRFVTVTVTFGMAAELASLTVPRIEAVTSARKTTWRAASKTQRVKLILANVRTLTAVMAPFLFPPATKPSAFSSPRNVTQNSRSQPAIKVYIPADYLDCNRFPCSPQKNLHLAAICKIITPGSLDNGHAKQEALASLPFLPTLCPVGCEPGNAQFLDPGALAGRAARTVPARQGQDAARRYGGSRREWHFVLRGGVAPAGR